MPDLESVGNRGVEISLRDFVGAAVETHKEHSDLRYQLLYQRLESTLANVTSRMDGLENAAALALHSNEQALLKAEAMTEKRFASVNEFRGMLNDVIATAMPRTEANLLMKAMQENVAANTERLNLTQGAGQGVKSSWLFVVGLIASIAGAGSLLYILMTA